MLRSAICAIAGASLLWGCSGSEGGSLPPPFDDDASPARFFFPSAVAVGAGTDASLYVANGNFDQTYSRATLVQVRLAAFDEAATAGGVLAADKAISRTGLLDNYAARAVATPTAVYVTSRGAGLLSRAPIAGGTLACPGTPGDCSANAIDLAAGELVDPGPILVTSVAFPGQAAAQPALLVSHLSPRSIGRTNEAAPARVAAIALPTSNPAAGKPFGAIGFSTPIGAFGVAALALDPVSREVFAGGCYERQSPERVFPCSATTGESPLRALSIEAGRAASVRALDLSSFAGGGDVQDLALSSDGSRLFLVTQNPNAFLSIDRPPAGSTARPVLRGLVPLGLQPGRLVVLPRASGDLVAVTSYGSDVVLVLDPASESIVKEVRVGDGPYDIAATPVGEGHRVFVTLFKGCGVAAIDVPKAARDAALLSTVGSCP